MNKKLLIPIAIAACSYSLPAIAASDSEIILQLTPAGKFLPSDGREMSVPHWYIDQAVATKVMQRFNARNQPVVIDYEHQTLHKETNGQPAPAAAWMRELIWREGEGLFVRAELTAKARAAIADKEILYISPVFRFNKFTGEVIEIEMAALTNTPAVHGMQALELRAAATFGYQSHTEEPDMKLLPFLISALSLAATEDEAITALTARLAQDPLKNLRDTLGLPATAGETEMVAACTSLKSKAPDPAKYIPLDTAKEMQGQIVALTQRLEARDAGDVDTEIKAALTDGRLIPAMETWARDLGKSNRAALTSYLQAAKPIAALNASQTNGKEPVKDEKTGLATNELAVCSQMGIAPEEFLKTKPAA